MTKTITRGLAALAIFGLQSWAVNSAEPVSLVIRNSSFAEGMNGWEVVCWGKAATAQASIDSSGDNSAHALKIVIPNRFSEIQVGATTPAILQDPARLHLLRFSCRFDSPLAIRALGIRAQYLNSSGTALTMLDGPGWTIQNPMVLYLNSREQAGAWERRSYVVPVVKGAAAVRIIVDLYGAEGTVLLDNFSLEMPEKINEQFLYYNPFNEPLGKPPYENFVKLFNEHSPFVKSGDKYNRLMVAQSLAQEKLEQIERISVYTGAPRDPALSAENVAILQEIEKLYAKYGALYQAKTPEKLAEKFGAPAAALQKRIEDFTARIEQEIVQRAEQAGIPAEQARAAQRLPEQKPIVIDEKGRPNQLVFGMLSKDEHFDMERALGDLKRVYTIPEWTGIGLTADKTALDFASLCKTMEEWRGRGVEYSELLLPFANANGSIVTPDFYAKNWDNPEIYMQRKYKPPKMEFSKNWGTREYNIFNPEVRESCRQVAEAYGKAFKDYRKIYIYLWEGGSPTVEGRTGGYGELAKKEFQKHLAQKFGTIKKLNETLRTSYNSFEEIDQPLDKRSIMGDSIPRNPIPACLPLLYEFETWLQLVQVDFNTLVYREVKKNDPGAVVMSDHTDVFRSLGCDPMTVFDYSDMISNHAYPLLIDIFRSLARHRPEKNFGAHEDQWGLRWEDPRVCAHRPSEERPWRSYIIRHVGKLADRDYTLQSWWYSYTRGEFILTYGSANWGNPAYDLTTFRYFATGLPTGIAMLRRFERPLMDSRKVPSRLLLMVPEATFYHQYQRGNAYEQMEEIHNLLFPANYAFESTTEKRVLGGQEDLSQYDVIISPFAVYYPKGLWKKLEPWIRQGGTLVSLGPCGIYDEYGFDNPESLTRPLISAEFPADMLNNHITSLSTDWGWKNGEPVQKHALGKGSIVLVTKPVYGVGEDPAQLERLLAVFRNVRREAWSPDTPVELTLRQDPPGHRYLFAVNPNGDATVKGIIEVAGVAENLKDLGIAGGYPVRGRYDKARDCTQFTFVLAPGSFTLYDLSGKATSGKVKSGKAKSKKWFDWFK